MIGAPWTRSLVPLAAGLVVLVALLGAARRWEPALADWARTQGLAWALLGLAGYGTAALLAVRSFPLLRDARLYALSLGLLPLAAVQFLGVARPWESFDAPGWSASLVERLDSFVVLLLPVVVLMASAVPEALPVRTLRLVTAAIGAVTAVVAGLLTGLVGPTLDALPFAGGIHAALCVIAGGVALGLWRSDGGLGGAVASMCALALVAGLAQLGVGFTSLLEWIYLKTQLIDLDDVALGKLPVGADRLLLLILPLGLVVVVAREWIVNLSHRTSLDTLTRLYNKDYARSIVEQTGMCDLGACFSVAVADIDHFKKVNDTHGHGAGDVVLHEVAQAIREAIGARGVVCRTGGEEITIFFPFLNLPEAAGQCERVRARVEARKIRIVDNERRRQRISVTVSVGVASNQDGEGGVVHRGVADVVQAADKALYAAKRGGRNRVKQGAG
ncbi:MAG: GGDEF domain-containing protein [Planctomycetes bacterium]|nr:GGDEF domain-containing protein [Planctomycetota bacterium]